MLHFSDLTPSIPFLLEGVLVTLKFTICSLLGGMPLGIFLALGKISKSFSLQKICQFYTSVFRGTPLLVQLGLVYYSVPQLTGYTISAFEAGILTFSLNSAAYTSEIIRSGIQSIDRGQWEAAQMLGLTYRQTLLGVIFPQVVRTTLPAIVNEIVDLLKESALVATIGEMDLLRRAQIIAAEKYVYFEPLMLIAVCYYIMVLCISSTAKYLERTLRI